MGESINGYIETKALSAADGGMCRWGFAEKDGREYFIKEFLAPKYPVDPIILGEEITQKMRQVADKFERDRRAYYDRLKTCRTGNNIIVLDFFRYKSKYYAVTDKVSGKQLSVGDVARLLEDQKYTLMKSLLYSIAKLHEAGIVHSDLKPENILIHETVGSYCTAKIIDFDSGYLETDPPENIIGSQNYFSPEAVLKTNGKTAVMTTRSDIFALGLLLHQYWCGEMPKFSEEYHYAAEAVLQDSQLLLDEKIPDALRDLIASMLQKYHGNRPTAQDVWKKLCRIESVPAGPADRPSTVVSHEPPPKTANKNPWTVLGNENL